MDVIKSFILLQAGFFFGEHQLVILLQVPNVKLIKCKLAMNIFIFVMFCTYANQQNCSVL